MYCGQTCSVRAHGRAAPESDTGHCGTPPHNSVVNMYNVQAGECGMVATHPFNGGLSRSALSVLPCPPPLLSHIYAVYRQEFQCLVFPAIHAITTPGQFQEPWTRGGPHSYACITVRQAKHNSDSPMHVRQPRASATTNPDVTNHIP